MLFRSKRNKNKFWWFGIAASIIGILFVFQQFVSFDNTNQVVTPIIVESGNDTLKNQIDSPLIIEETQQVVQKQLKETPVNLKLNTDPNYNTTAKNKKQKEQQSQMASLIVKKEEAPSLMKSVNISDEDLSTSVTNTKDLSLKTVAQISDTETSESEIEDLLNSATKDIQLSDNNTINTIAVDAKALLEDVETEMPPSLRGQLFKVIEKNFKTAKTAVATRNE